ncbi:MAG TPA: DUF2066 domain-containing protein [Stellaceae bacterium]|jgi:hypothetical protein
MFDRRIRIACCAAFALWWLAPSSAFADDDGFTVAGVHADVTAASALAAKDQAQAEAQSKAFETLMGRMAQGKAPHLNSAQITDLVAGFEVANEQTSPVRYIADYTFHFNPAAVRKLLETSSVAFTPNPVKPVVVLPVLAIGGRSELWDDPNPWRDAWAKRAGVEATLPVVVPVGDLADVAAIDAPKALAGDRVAIKAISSRYQNDDVLVVQGRPASGPRRFEVTAARYSHDGGVPAQTATVATAAKPGESDADLMTRAIAATIDKLGQSWKAANTVDPNISGTIDATLTSASLADWVAVRNRLRAIPSVRGTDLLSFDRSQIRIAIRYIGDQNQFRAALGERGLALGGADPDWTLALHVAPAPAPAPPPDAGAKPDAGQQDNLRKADE